MVEVLKRAAGLALLSWAALLAWQSAQQWPWRRSIIPLVLRFLVLVLVGALLFYPSLVTEKEVVERPLLAVLLDASASMNLPDVTGENPRRVRAQATVRDLVKRHGQKLRVVSYVFDGDVRQLVASPETVPFLGEGSNVSGALRRVVTSSEVEKVRAAFLVSDGRVTRGSDPRGWARQSPFPIHAVQMGPSALEYVDLSIEALSAPETAFKDGEITIEVRVASHGSKETLSQRVPVVLLEGDHEVAREVLTPADESRVTLVHRPLTAGFVTYRVRLGAIAGELTELNNEEWTVVLVEDEPRRVLLASGAPDAELGFFRRSCAGDPRYRLETLVEARRSEQVRCSHRDLSPFALVVVHRFSRSRFEPAFVEALATYLRGGGALLLIGNGPVQASELLKTPLSEFLHFSAIEDKPLPLRRGPVLLERAYQFHPLLRVVPHPQANLLAWRNLPPILPGVVATKETGAGFVLASFNVPPVGRVPAIAYRSFGTGVLVYVNTQEAWRWKLATALAATKVDVYSGLFKNIVGWTADRGRASGLRLVTSRRRYFVGAPVTVFLEDFQGRVQAGATGLSVKRVRTGEEGTTTIPLRPVRGGWRGEFVAERPGVTTLTFEAPDGTEAETRVVAVLRGEEFRKPTADTALLRDIASLSGGRALVTGEKPLAIKIDDRPFVDLFRSSIFWLDEWWLLVLLLVLLCGEWVARRVKTRI